MNSQGKWAAKFSTVNEELGRDDDRREESGSGVEQAYAGLFADIGEVAEVPRDEIIDLVKRSQRHVNCVRNELSMKYPPRNISFRENGDLFGKIKAIEVFDYFEVTCAVRLVDTLQLTLNQDRTVNLVFREFVLKPTDGQIAAKRIAIVEIRSDDRCLKIKA